MLYTNPMSGVSAPFSSSSLPVTEGVNAGTASAASSGDRDPHAPTAAFELTGQEPQEARNLKRHQTFNRNCKEI